MVDGGLDQRQVGAEALAHRRLDAGGIQPQPGQELGMVAMLDEHIRQAQLQHRQAQPQGIQALTHRTAGPAHDRAFFERDQGIMAAGQLGHQAGVQRLGKTHIGHMASSASAAARAG